MTRTLDLRQFVEARRGKNIANLLTVLQEGESFTLLNDSDPKELLEKLEVNGRQKLRLEYLEQGPRAWRLKLTKLADSGETEGCCGCCGG